MILRRLGCKKRLAEKITKYFPEKIDLFIDMFFGTGSITWKIIDQVKYVIANDLNDDVFNLYMVVKNNKKQFLKELSMFPVHQSLFKYWKKNPGRTSIEKAIRFLFLSNFSVFGTMTTMSTNSHNTKKIIEDNVEQLYQYLKYVVFMHEDFRNVLKKISFREKSNTFIYADPPYLETSNKYDIAWNYQDSFDLFSLLVESGFPFAISEFDNPKITELIKKFKLKKIALGKRTSIKAVRSEILIINY